MIGVGQLVTADDKKPKRVARKLQKSTCYVSVTPSQFDDYFSYTYKSYLALAIWKPTETFSLHIKDYVKRITRMSGKHRLSKHMKDFC